jgi:arylsulfatase A-like enzyme
MAMRDLIVSLMFAALFASFAVADEPRTGAPAGGAFNVLLISLDTLRADHCGCYGYDRDTSPNLDQFAGEGVLFENATAASSWTIPSHMSLFTSLYPSTHGVGSIEKCLGDAVPTMAEVLLAHGYTTAAFVTGPALNHTMGINRGFESYDDFTVRMMCDTNLFEDLDAKSADLNQVPTNHVITNLGAAWLRKNAGERFFLFLHYWDCHFDYVPPAPYSRRFDPDYRGAENGRDMVRRQEELEEDASPEVKKHLMALYDGEVAHTDAHLGKVLKALDDLNLSERTLVVVFSDHGEGFWEHGKLCHGYGLQEELLHVVLLMKLPGVLPADSRIKGNVSHVDVLPTVLGLLGLPKPEVTHGMDLSGVCLGREELPNRPIFSELDKEEHNMRAVRWGPFKMVQEKAGPAGPLLIVRDGKETEWRAGADEEAAREVRGEMEAALKDGPLNATSPDRLAKAAAPDEETLRLLRSLGYAP